MNRMFFPVLGCAVMAAVLAAPVHAQDMPDLDAVVAQVADYQFGESTAALNQIEEIIRQTQNAPEKRVELERKLAQILDGGAGDDAKQFVCRQLYVIGSPVSVPALAKLLVDEDLSHMARYALEGMKGENVDQALIGALDDTKGRQRIGIIESLGRRGNAMAIDDLVQYVTDDDKAVGAAAIEAIGRIGGEKAATALFEGSLELPEGQGDALVKAMLLIADSLNKSSDAMALALYEEVFRADTEPVNKAAALKGIVAMRGASPTLTDFVLQQLDSDVPEVREAAGQTVRTLPGGSQATTLLAKGLSSLSVEGKILLIQALKDRGDKGAGAAILDAARAEDLQVRFAAVEALGKLGGADAVDMLATTALDSEDGEFAEAARKSLTQLSGPGVDEAIIERIGKSSTGEQSLLIALLAERNAQSALPFLMTLARSGDEAARIAAADALAVLSRGENVNELVELLIAQQGDAAQSALERAVIETAQRVMPAEKQADAVLMAAAAAGANGALKATLLNVAGSIGGAKALEGLRTASADADPAVRGAAIRALANWATPDALDDLKQIAETTDIADLRAIAVDGYIRQLRLTSDRSMDDTLARYEDAIALASSLDQKRQILAGLAEVHDARAIALVEKIGADEALKQESELAAQKIREAVQ